MIDLEEVKQWSKWANILDYGIMAWLLITVVTVDSIDTESLQQHVLWIMLSLMLALVVVRHLVSRGSDRRNKQYFAEIDQRIAYKLSQKK